MKIENLEELERLLKLMKKYDVSHFDGEMISINRDSFTFIEDGDDPEREGILHVL